MPRPKKDNAEYFSHDNNMRNDPKIKALRRKYGIAGYAIFNMLLEVLTESERFNVKVGKVHIELLAGDFDCEPDLLFDLIEYSVSIELLHKDGENIFSSGLKKRLAPVVEKRELARKKEEERKRFLQQKRQESGVSVTETTHNPPVSASETTQSKVKESKEEKKYIKKSHQAFTPPTLDEVKVYFLENSYTEHSAIKAFNYYNSANWKDSKGNQVKNWKQKMQGVWFKDDNKIQTVIPIQRHYLPAN